MARAAARVIIVGIVNCTPDSFSDGDAHATASSFCDRGQALVDAGAEVLDIGGDSTRPGSECCGIETEWQRVAPVLAHFAHRVPCSIDTHHAEVARRAIAEGATIINDVTAGRDPGMLSIVTAAAVKFVAMFNPHGAAHQFGTGVAQEDVMLSINAWGADIRHRFDAAGGSQEHLILDTGMGAFIGNDPEVSWEIVRRYGEISWPKGGAMLGCSRKGFLRIPGERDSSDRDGVSALCGVIAASKLAADIPLYLRVHNVVMQRAAVEAWMRTLS